MGVTTTVMPSGCQTSLWAKILRVTTVCTAVSHVKVDTTSSNDGPH